MDDVFLTSCSLFTEQSEYHMDDVFLTSCSLFTEQSGYHMDDVSLPSWSLFTEQSEYHMDDVSLTSWFLFTEQSEYHMDDVLLAYFLKGCCLSHMKVPLQAAECFTYVISNEKKIKEDKYLVPSSLLEVAILHLYGENCDLNQAKTLLEYAKLVGNSPVRQGHLCSHQAQLLTIVFSAY